MFENFPFSVNLNWVDLVILAALIFYAVEGYAVGFIASLLDLISFILAFVIGLKAYSFVGKGIQSIFSISAGFSNALGFLISASVSEIVIGIVSRRIIYAKYFSRINMSGPIFRSFDRILGSILGILSGLILFSFILSVIVGLPISVFLKHSVTTSRIGGFLITKTQGFENDLSNVFGGAVNDTLNFLTVEPKSNESVSLNFKTSSTKIDKNSEMEMFIAVNRERALQNLSALKPDDALTKVARAHCKDMFKRGYFSHYTPEDFSPFDRMAQAGINFTYAGENLALAPNVEIAMQGLMKSPGHKANILSPNFGTLGVGAIDGGVYGEMYCQEFTN